MKTTELTIDCWVCSVLLQWYCSSSCCHGWEVSLSLSETSAWVFQGQAAGESHLTFEDWMNLTQSY